VRHFLPFTLLAVSTAVFAAASAPVDAGKSKITATFTQMGVGVDGAFKKFSGRLTYDAANVAGSSAELSVDTSSFDIGDEDYNAEVRKKEWFDSKAFPAATFKSTSIKPLGADRFEATGTLTMKGKSVTVRAPVTVKTEGSNRRFEGEVPVSRAAFAMGDKEWNEVLEDEVLVKFVIVAPAG